MPMQYLHTMVRISDVDASLRFYCDLLGMKEVRRYDSEKGRFTNIFLAAPADEKDGASDKKAPLLELTYNWDLEEYKTGRAWRSEERRVGKEYVSTCKCRGTPYN